MDYGYLKLKNEFWCCGQVSITVNNVDQRVSVFFAFVFVSYWWCGVCCGVGDILCVTLIASV